jgi:AraC-like DNA-binding protein
VSAARMELIVNVIKKYCTSCGRVESSSWTIEEAYFPFYRTLYVEEGGAVFKDLLHEKILVANHLYLFPAKKYSITLDENKKFIHTWFHVYSNPFLFDDIIDFDIQQYPVLQRFIPLLVYLAKDNSLENEGKYFSAINDVVNALFNVLYVLQPFYKKLSPRIEMVVDYINKNIDKDLSNDELANIALLNKSYFIKLFTIECYVPPQKYILNLKIANAMEMFSKNMGLDEISKALGYLDSKSFSRAFKRIVGFSPSHYRKSTIIQGK